MYIKIYYRIDAKNQRNVVETVARAQAGALTSKLENLFLNSFSIRHASY